jgi:hypothetical protein
MSRSEVTTWLQAAGWFMISGKGEGCWLAPGWRHLGGGEYLPAEGEIKFFTFTTAIQMQLINEWGNGRRR